MAQTLTNKQWIEAFYVAYFGRAGDPSGVAYWLNLVNTGKLTLAGVAENFAQQPEATAEYAYFNAVYNFPGYPITDAMYDQFVTQVYQNLFERDPDANGKAYWIQQLKTGASSPGAFIANIIFSAMAGQSGDSAEDWATVYNKALAAEYFTDYLVENNITWTQALSDQVTAILDNVDETSNLTTVFQQIEDAVNQTGPVPGQTFTLTDKIDNLTGTAGDDIFIGDAATTSAADQINGGGGTDTLKLYGTTTKPVISSIEHIYLNAPGGDFDISGNSAVTSLEIDSEAVTAARTYTVTSGQAVKLTNMTQNGATAVTIAGNTPTSLDLTVNKVGTSTVDRTLDFSGTALTTLNVTSSGNASYLNVNNAGGKLETINISGDKNIWLQHALTTVKTINASSATGNVTIDGVGASNLTFTGGSGNDKIVMGTTITGSDKLDGGAGDDTLSVSDADTIDSTAEVANIKNFEYFEAAAADATTYDMSYLLANNSFKGLIVSGGATVTVSNLTAAMANNIKIVADTTTVLSSSDFVSGGTSDTATIKLGDTAQKISDIDVTSLTFTNVDVINIVSNSDGTPVGTVGGTEENSIKFTATDLEKIVATGDEALVIETAAGTLPTEIDASGMTAAVSVDTDASAIVSILVKGTAKNDTIDLDNAATLTTTLYLGGGNDTVTVRGGGTGNHTLIYTATALNSGDVKAGSVSTITLTGVAAGDKVILNFGSAIEALLKNGGTVLGTSTANVNIHGTTLSANTNVAAAQSAGNMVLQIDLNGDGVYNAADDWQITLVGTGTDDTLVYDAANDYFVFTVV